MSKWAGKIGFAISIHENDIYTDLIVEKPYKGETIKSSYKWQQSNEINDNFTINKQVSVIANNFAYRNIGVMKYVTVLGIKWKIISAEPQYPRIILTMGGIWNGNET